MFWVLLGQSNASCSSKNLCGSGFSKLQRQHHMNIYCVTEGCILECLRSLCFKTMWAGKKSFKDFQDRPNVCVPAMLETPRNIFGPSDVKFFTWWTTLCTGIPRRSAADFQARFPSGQMTLEPVILSHSMTHEWKVQENWQSHSMTHEWKVQENWQSRSRTHEWKVQENLQFGSSVAWCKSGKFKRTYSSVAWRMSGKNWQLRSMTHEWKVQETLQ